MKQITKAQLSKIHVMLIKLNLVIQKSDLVQAFTDGRATSSKDMTINEATEMIRYLQTCDPCEKMRRKVFAIAYEAGMIYGDSPDDKKMNAAKINAFLISRGAVKKELHRMTSTELVKVINQFEQMKKHKGESQANKATKNLLAELDISVAQLK